MNRMSHVKKWINAWLLYWMERGKQFGFIPDLGKIFGTWLWDPYRVKHTLRLYRILADLKISVDLL
jgi:ABC-type amino acid transport substrate-binding protein